MKKTVLILIVTLILVSSSNLFSEQVSVRKAMLYSALVPGLGEMYLSDYTRAGIFLGAEILIIASYLQLNREVDWKTNSYQLYAYRYADVPVGGSDSYYRLINSYISSEQYNAEIELYFRNRFIVYEYNPQMYNYYLDLYLISDEDAWEWASRENWLAYRELRREKQRLEIYTNFAIGAAVLNRLISVIDSAILAKKVNRERTVLSQLSIEPDFIKKGYMISYEFKF